MGGVNVLNKSGRYDTESFQFRVRSLILQFAMIQSFRAQQAARV